MANILYVQKNAEKEAVLKISGNAATTITLASLKSDTQIYDASKARVSITSLVWTGDTDGIVTITRGAVTICTLQANAAGMLEMSGQMLLPDDMEGDKDLVVTMNGIQCELWLRLRKVTGYTSQYDIGVNGVYD